MKGFVILFAVKVERERDEVCARAPAAGMEPLCLRARARPFHSVARAAFSHRPNYQSSLPPSCPHCSHPQIQKQILLGDAACGKSSLLVRLTDNRFLQHSEPSASLVFSRSDRLCGTGACRADDSWHARSDRRRVREPHRRDQRGALSVLLLFLLLSRTSDSSSLLPPSPPPSLHPDPDLRPHTASRLAGTASLDRRQGDDAGKRIKLQIWDTAGQVCSLALSSRRAQTVLAAPGAR